MTDATVTMTVSSHPLRNRLAAFLVAVAALACLALGPSTAQSSAAPALDVTTSNLPPVMALGGSAQWRVSVANVGDETIPDGAITVTATIPEPLSVRAVALGNIFGTPIWNCTVSPDKHTVTCVGPKNFDAGLKPDEDPCQSAGVPCDPRYIGIAVKARSEAPLDPVTLEVEACGGAPACASASASTSFRQLEFGFANINTGEPGVPVVPAFPPDNPEALWAGTCDLGSSNTSNGGTQGAGGVPPIRGHCIDIGGSALGDGQGSPWPTGEEPTWRLDPVTQAGAHPDATATFWWNYNSSNQTYGTVKNITVKLPPGVVGNPEALPPCSATAVQAMPPECEAKSQVGITTLSFGACAGFSECANLQTKPVYAIEARDTVTAEFLIGGIAGFVNVPITARGRTNGDYGVDTLALLIPDFTPLAGQAFTFWGVPWAKEHDKFRIHGAIGIGAKFQSYTQLTDGYPANMRVSYDPSWGAIKPFFTNPTQCSGERLPLTVETDSWQEPVTEGGPLISASSLADPVTNCEEIEFNPSIKLRPDVSVADSPSGLDVELSIPQNNDPPADVAFDSADDTGAPAFWKTPAGRGTAHLKDTTIHLPRGTSFNPAAADGLQGCTTAQIGLTAASPKVTFNNDPVQCPESSKIGTLEIVSPLLHDPLSGAVYAAPQNDNPFPGSLTAIYLISQDEERGLSIKLAGKVDLDPDTGQIATTFVDNPQSAVQPVQTAFRDRAASAVEHAADLWPVRKRG